MKTDSLLINEVLMFFIKVGDVSSFFWIHLQFYRLFATNLGLLLKTVAHCGPFQRGRQHRSPSSSVGQKVIQVGSRD